MAASGLETRPLVSDGPGRRRSRDWLLVFVKGMAMGAADAVPGVSGGTLAFITGIYQELLDSIRALTPAAVGRLLRRGPAAFWVEINGSFLLVLGAGILLSLTSLARLALYLLETHPTLLWGFFFGLILASAVWMLRQVDRWTLQRALALALGVLLGFKLTLLTPAQAELSHLLVFAIGALALCAMILPGVSGSFILLMLGAYGPLMAAVQDPGWALLGLFMLGGICGLLTFSHLVGWALRHYRQATLALLTGLMLGALNRVWPWQYTASYRIDAGGAQVPLEQHNVLPGSYTALTGQDAQLMTVLGLMILGAALVYSLEAVRPAGINRGSRDC